MSSILLHGDCLDLLTKLAPESFHACVTDPPYGIGFMGREWDTFKPGQHTERKLPQWDGGAKHNPNLKGRSRSPAISPSQIEYDMTVEGLRGFQVWTEQWALEVLRVLKPGAYLVVCGAPRSYHRMACGLEDAGFVIRDKFVWLFGSGFPKSRNLGDGKGTALKPGHEPIVLAWKPFKGTIDSCHRKHGTAALNLDACRIEYEENPRHEKGGSYAVRNNQSAIFGAPLSDPTAPNDLGRWPPNVLLDEEAAEMLDAMTGERPGNTNKSLNPGSSVADVYNDGFIRTMSGMGRADTGGASHFYYVAKASREEREFGCEGLVQKARDESRKEGNPGGDNPRNRGLQHRGNFHPTVKPIALMRWLVRLVTPLDGVVLDPFTGSGTTGMACRYEHRSFVGIEREAEYVTIAERRIAAVAPLFAEGGSSVEQ